MRKNGDRHMAKKPRAYFRFAYFYYFKIFTFKDFSQA